MVVLKKAVLPTVKSEKDINKIINQGGKPSNDMKSEDVCVNISLRIPRDLFEEIEKRRSVGIFVLRRTQFILQCIVKGLKEIDSNEGS